MAVLNIRSLPTSTHARLRMRAALAGRSMEAEARAIIAAACRDEHEPLPHAALLEWVDKKYGAKKPRNASDDLIAERRRESRKS